MYIIKHDQVTGRNGKLLNKGESHSEAAFINVENLLRIGAIELVKEKESKKKDG